MLLLDRYARSAAMRELTIIDRNMLVTTATFLPKGGRCGEVLLEVWDKNLIQWSPDSGRASRFWFLRIFSKNIIA